MGTTMETVRKQISRFRYRKNIKAPGAPGARAKTHHPFSASARSVNMFQCLWAILFLTVGLLVGCGQKGPLYYPSEAEKASLKAEKEARKAEEAKKETPGDETTSEGT